MGKTWRSFLCQVFCSCRFAWGISTLSRETAKPQDGLNRVNPLPSIVPVGMMVPNRGCSHSLHHSSIASVLMAQYPQHSDPSVVHSHPGLILGDFSGRSEQGLWLYLPLANTFFTFLWSCN